MMRINIKEFFSEYDFEVVGPSYVGKPQNNTFMYASKKIESQVGDLAGCVHCLLFAETGMIISERVLRDNAVIFSENPQLSYVKFATIFQESIEQEERENEYRQTEAGYYIGKNVRIGENAYIEPNVLIGHGVVIGDNAVIRKGSVIKNAVIGNDFVSNEYAVVGADGFTMATDENGDKVRIPSLGKVIIKDHVEVGAHNNISRGSGGDTRIEDYVKLDAFVYIGHDALLRKNTEIAAGK